MWMLSNRVTASLLPHHDPDRRSSRCYYKQPAAGTNTVGWSSQRKLGSAAVSFIPPRFTTAGVVSVSRRFCVPSVARAGPGALGGDFLPVYDDSGEA